MFGYLDQLRALTKRVRIGIIGIGSIGSGMLYQSWLTPGIECVAIADIELERAIACAVKFGRDYRTVQTEGEMRQAIGRGKLAVCQDGEMVARCEQLDLVVEATSSIGAGGQHAITALQNGKHVVMMNYEADLLFGAFLMQLASENDLVYTVCDGDQPAVLVRLIAELRFMGFQLVMAGNIKGFLDRYANPTSIIPEADKRKLDYRMCVSYTDGTKLGVEMAVLANGLGLRTAVPGMIGPRVSDIYDVFDHFDFATLWQGEQPVVDYVLGAKPKGGVFAIGYTDHPHQQETLAWFPPEMGAGPFYLFYRPYHLGHFESMASVAEAILHHRSVLKPDHGFRTNVYAYAKRDLVRGETLDGIGGYTCYGLAENCSDNEQAPGLPICLSENVTLRHDITKDSKVLLGYVSHDPQDPAFLLHEKAVQIAGQQAGNRQAGR